MELKRKFDPADLAAWQLAKASAARLGLPEPSPPAPTHVEVRHTGTNPEQNFSRRLVEQAVLAGLMRVEGDRLYLKTAPDQDDLGFTIRRAPGYYQASTGERIPIGEMAMTRMLRTGMGDLTRAEAVTWLTARGAPQTDYEVTNAYECVLDAEQHAMYRAVPDAKGRRVAAHTLED